MPSGVPALMCARNMSPVAMWGTPASVAMAVACVPLPAPGGPNIRRSRATELLRQEALVVPHRQLRLHLPHDVERDAYDDQDRGTAESAGRRLREAELVDQDVRQDRDDAEE